MFLHYPRSNYPVTRQVGAGTCSTVWEGVCQTTGARVAVKVFNSSYDFSSTDTLREFVLAGIPPHPGVLTPLDVGNNYLVFPLGTTDLETYLKTSYPIDKYSPKTAKELDAWREGPLVESIRTRITHWKQEVLEIFRDIVLAVRHLHASGILHCDLKLKNVIMFQEGDRLVPKVADFGLWAPPTGIFGSGIICTEFNRPPEVFCEAGYDSSADVWSLGCMLWEMMTDTHLFWRGDGMTLANIHRLTDLSTWPKGLAWLQAHHPGVTCSPGGASYSWIDLDLHRLLKLILKPDPSSRPGCDEILAALGHPVSPAPVTFPRRLPLPSLSPEERMSFFRWYIKKDRTIPGIMIAHEVWMVLGRLKSVGWTLDGGLRSRVENLIHVYYGMSKDLDEEDAAILKVLSWNLYLWTPAVELYAIREDFCELVTMTNQAFLHEEYTHPVLTSWNARVEA